MSHEQEIVILKKAGCADNVIDHCMAVKECALNISSMLKFETDMELIRKGAIYHDIGRSKTHGISHAVEGAKIAEEYRFKRDVIQIIERHIGAGITTEEAVELALPPGNYMPETFEEKIVSYADNLLSGAKLLTFDKALLRMQKFLGKGHPALNRFKEMHLEIQSWMGA